MANSLSASFPEVRAGEMQREFFKKNVAKVICNFQTWLDGKSYGDTLNRVYSSMPEYPDAYTRGNSIPEVDLTDTKESLVINKQYAYRFYIDDFDNIQDKYSVAIEYWKKTWEYLSNQVDADVLAEALNAASSVDGWTLSNSNVMAVLWDANQALAKKNIMSRDRYAVISPEFENQLVQYAAGRQTVLWDKIGMNGYTMTFMGYDFYTSNLLCGSAELALATKPTANDTVTIAWVTFTFVSTIGTTPGNVLIGADADATRANLAALINAPATTTTKGVALSDADAKLFAARISATNDNTWDKLTVVAKWVWTLAVDSSLTAGTDWWTATAQLQHNLFGVKGNPYLIMQRQPSVTEVEAQDKMWKYFKNAVLYGVKTFHDNAQAMVDVTIRSDAFTA